MGRAVTGRKTAGAWILLVVATSAPASAQQPAPTDELNQAILRYAFRVDGGNVRLVPGRVPDDLAPNFHVPPGTRVLGTVIMNSGALVLASTTTPPESLRAEYMRALGPRGWSTPERQSRGGFVSSSIDLPLVLCRGVAQLHVQHARRAAATYDLHLEYRDVGAMCEGVSAGAARFERMEEPRFPTLYAPAQPPGVSLSRCYSRAGRRGRSSSLGTMTIVPADLPAADLLRHYGRQLEASGWQPPGGQASPMVATGTWSRTDSTGIAQLTLNVSEAAPRSGCYEVAMRVTR